MSHSLDDQDLDVQEQVTTNVTRLEHISYMQNEETLDALRASMRFPEILNTGFGIDSIDQSDEHTPTNEEYQKLRSNAKFKGIVRQLGGLQEVKRVKSGTRGMIMNRIHVDNFLKATNEYKRVVGWCVLVGKPTGVLFLPFFWLQHKETGQWKSISGFPDESSLLLATSKLESFNSIGSHVFKSVALFPCVENQQTIEDFQRGGVFGSTSLVHVSIE